MEACEQAPGLNMLQHGQLVHHHYKLFMSELANGVDSDVLNKLYDVYKNKLPPPSLLQRYHTYHDGAKHLCLTIIDGRRQFPHHAEISAKQYSIIFPEDGFTKRLIEMDMDFHVNRGDDLLKTCQSPFAPILYFTAWAELNANAEMFGGKTSESYKIKRSRLIQAGKKLLTI